MVAVEKEARIRVVAMRAKPVMEERRRIGG